MKRIALTCALVLAVAGVTGGCGGQSGDDGGEGAAAVATPAAEAPEPAPQTAEPATGTEVSIDRLSVRVPEGWVPEELPIDVPNTLAATLPDKTESIGVTSPPIQAGESMDGTVLESNMRRDGFRILEPLELGGHTFSRGQRRDSDGDTLRVVSVVDRYLIAITFYFDPDVEQEQRQATMDAILATAEIG